MSRCKPSQTVWRRPLQLAALTAAGLLAALLGTGPWRVVSWLCLAPPLISGIRYLTRPPFSRR